MMPVVKCSSVLLFIFLLFGCESIRPVGSSIPATRMDSIDQMPYHPLRNVDDLDNLVNAIGDSRVVLLGGSTHGTHEFYQYWSALTKKLIEVKGFIFVAVEGDWDDSYGVNLFVKGKQQNSEGTINTLKQYQRWPASMWSNYETAAFVEWLNTYDQNIPGQNKIGFYGIDLYGFWEWTNKPLPVQYSKLQPIVNELRDSFAGMGNDAFQYAADVRKRNADLSSLTQKLWSAVQKKIDAQPVDEDAFVLQQHVLLSLEGEKYFRALVKDKQGSWNIRARYMAEAIQRLLNFYGPNSKAVIWVHNSHAGDAQYSQMAGADTSVGEILKEQLGNSSVFSIGFGTNTGTVLAGSYWNAPLQEIPVPPAIKGSWENILHDIGPGNKIIISKDLIDNQAWDLSLPFRSIGDIYTGKDFYGTAIVPKRFDAFVYIDSTTAVHSLNKK